MPPERHKILDNSEMRMLIDAAAALGCRAYLFLLLVLLTLQRAGEVAQLRWQRLDLERGLWARDRSLAHSDSQLPLSDPVIRVLTHVRSHNDLSEDRVFCRVGRETAFLKQVRRAINAQIIAIDPDAAIAWRVHDLRRTSAWRCHGFGISPETFAFIFRLRAFDRWDHHIPISHAGQERRARAFLEAWSSNFLSSVLQREDIDYGLLCSTPEARSPLARWLGSSRN